MLSGTGRRDTFNPPREGKGSLKPGSLEWFYRLAILEGEGLGTAYEYYAKARILARLLRGPFKARAVLIAGLPEKYGTSLDLIALAKVHDLKVTIVEDRSAAIDRFEEAIAKVKANDLLNLNEIELIRVRRMADFREEISPKRFDLAVSTEVLQRLSSHECFLYLRSLSTLTRQAALFVPNGGNRAHLRLTGLRSMSLDELLRCAGRAKVVDKGYVDMPPFPPGLKRSAAGRRKTLESRFQMLIMRGLQLWNHLEVQAFDFIKRRNAHIVYLCLFFQH